MKKFLTYFLIFIILSVIAIYATGNQYVFKGIRLVYLKGNLTASIFDKDDFPNRKVLSKSPKTLPKNTNSDKNSISPEFENYLKGNKTAAFLVLKNDSLIFERYFQNFNEKSVSNSFSMAKTVTVLLTLMAVEDGFIQSLNDPITNYLPEMKEFERAKQCTIWDLAAMTSGYDWDEDYFFPINPTAEAYYGENLDEVILTRGFTKKPHTEFKYLSGNTQLLGFVLQRALKTKSISEYLTEKIWIPLEMDSDAFWTIDHKNGTEKTYCCLHAKTRDFAKLGLLFLQQGKWNGEQIISEKHINEMISPNGFTPHYGLGLWMDYTNKEPFYYFRGHLGQYVICLPKQNTVIVRVGEWKSPVKRKNTPHSEDTYRYIKEGVLIANQANR